MGEIRFFEKLELMPHGRRYKASEPGGLGSGGFG